MSALADKHAKAMRERDKEIAELRAALEVEWQSNHSEHCQWDWPHDGRCMYPRPAILGAP